MSRPNLVFIMCDQFRQMAIGCYDGDPVITPNLDRFAKTGIVLTHAISNRPVCSPYRGMLWTGQYPLNSGLPGNCYTKTMPFNNWLDPEKRCISDVLHDAGYSQGYIGKWHLDPVTDEDNEWTEGPRGDGNVWDSFTRPRERHGIDFWHSYGCCDKHFNPHYWEGDDIKDRIDPHEWSVKHEADVAVEYLKNTDGHYRDNDKPFTLFVSHNPPHTPFNQVPDEWLEKYEGKDHTDLLNRPNVKLEGQGEKAIEGAKQYFAAVTGIDYHFGRIMDTLEQEGLRENTIVVFTADHGELMGSHGRMHNCPWYDECFLIPFIISWPGKLEPGKDDLLLSVPDTMPTLLSMMGCGDMIPEEVEGSDLSECVMTGQGERPDSAMYYCTPPEDPHSGARGIRTHKYCFAINRYFKDEDEVHLYDMEKDPYQMNNIAEDNPEVVEELKEKMKSWFEKTGDNWSF